jgi:electron transfer flavoprotein beta subunit
MANLLHIVVCAGIVPDPLQTLEPVTGPAGPGLKNEMVLPAVLDPWAASALYEAAALAAKNPGSKLWLVSLGPKAKLQQVMMTVAQKVAFELVPIDGPIGGFPDAHSTAAVLAETIAALPGLDRTKLLLFGGWESATRGAGVTLQLVGERLGITDQFQGVDQIDLRDDGSLKCWSASKAASIRSRSAPEPRRAGLGHRQSGRAAQQSANRHGQHAHDYARPRQRPKSPSSTPTAFATSP